MKFLFKLFKIIGIVFLSILFLSLITVVVAKIYEDDLAKYTVAELEAELNAPMSIGDVSLIPLYSFPRISAEINKLYVGDPQYNNDTLFYIKSVRLGLDTWDLISGVYTIEKLEFEGLDFDYIVDKEGNSNLDFIMESFMDTSEVSTEDTTNSSLDFIADKLTLRDIQIRYVDSSSNMSAHLQIPEINFKAKSKNSFFDGKSNGSFILRDCSFENTSLNEMESCLVTFDFQFDNQEVKIKELNISSEGLEMGMEGEIIQNESIGIDAVVDFKTLDLEILRKYIPAEYTSTLGNGSLASINPIRIDFKANYKEDKVDIENLDLESDGLKFLAIASIANADTMAIDAEIQALNMDFGVLRNYIPNHFLEEAGIKELGGQIEASAKINGFYADSTQMPAIEALVNTSNLSLQAYDYPKIDAINSSIQLTTKGSPDFNDIFVQITNAEILSSNSRIEFDASVAGLENPHYFFKSNVNLQLEDFASMVPDTIATSLTGQLAASMNTSGVLPSTINDDFVDYFLDNSSLSLNLHQVSTLIGDTLALDDFSTNFEYTPLKPGEREIQISKLKLASKELDLNLKNTSVSAILSGKTKDPMKMGVQLNDFNIQNGNIRFYGNASFSNFEKPDFDLSTTLDIQLNELAPFLPDTLIQDMSGFASAKINSKGSLNIDSLDTQMMKVLFEDSDFTLTMFNGKVDFTDSLMNVDQISGNFSLKDDVFDISHFKIRNNGATLELDSTQIKNIYSAVLLNQKKELYVQTHIKVGDVVFNNFKSFMDDEEAEEPAEIETESSSEEIQNWTYLIHGSATINSFIVDSLELEEFNINKMHVHDISTLFKLSDSSYIMDQFKFKAFEGEMNNSVHYRLRQDGTQSVSTRHLVTNMNMRTLLQDMDNFGMDSLISYKNISGLLSTDLNTFVPIEDSVRIDKMMISGDVSLEKGGVYDYAPAQEMSKFTGIKELDNIQFKTLRSNIFMFKNKLYVPRTNIVSNAIDIAAFGMQDLNGDSEYHLEIHLSNILFGKSKKRNKKQNESGDEIDKESLKKSSRKIRYAVEEGKSKVGLASKDSREDMMNKIRVQRKMLDFIFFPKNIHYDTTVE